MLEQIEIKIAWADMIRTVTEWAKTAPLIVVKTTVKFYPTGYVKSNVQKIIRMRTKGELK